MDFKIRFYSCLFLAGFIGFISGSFYALLIAIPIFFIGSYYLISGDQPNAHENENLTQKHVDISQMLNWPILGNFDFEVVGESFYQNAIAAIAETGLQEFTAVLTPYDSNPYDDKAVKVEINGLIVGHLSKEDARSFRRRLGTKKMTNQPSATRAIITGGHQGKNGEKMSYGVQLDLKPFDN